MISGAEGWCSKDQQTSYCPVWSGLVAVALRLPPAASSAIPSELHLKSLAVKPNSFNSIQSLWARFTLTLYSSLMKTSATADMCSPIAHKRQEVKNSGGDVQREQMQVHVWEILVVLVLAPHKHAISHMSFWRGLTWERWQRSISISSACHGCHLHPPPQATLRGSAWTLLPVTVSPQPTA